MLTDSLSTIRRSTCVRLDSINQQIFDIKAV